MKQMKGNMHFKARKIFLGDKNICQDLSLFMEGYLLKKGFIFFKDPKLQLVILDPKNIPLLASNKSPYLSVLFTRLKRSLNFQQFNLSTI